MKPEAPVTKTQANPHGDPVTYRPRDQVLAHGSPRPKSPWPSLPGRTGIIHVPPERLVAFLFGFPSTGKTAFLSTNPDAYILNLDLSSTTCPDPKATFWPDMDPKTGKILTDDPDNPFDVLSWSHVIARIETLKEIARKGLPRPSTVVFDSLSSMIRLMRSWLPSQADKYAIAREPKSDWYEMFGQAAYDVLYDLIVRTIRDLRSHGYGVWVVGHVINSKMAVGENAYVFSPELTVTANFWKRLFDIFDLSIYMDSEESSEISSEEQKVVIKGKEVTIRRKKSQASRVYFLTTSNPSFRGIIKERVPLPSRIEIPQVDGWKHFSEVYRQAFKEFTGKADQENSNDD